MCGITVLRGPSVLRLFPQIPGAGRVLVPAVSRECLCKVQQRRASLQSVFGIVVHEYFLDGHFLVLEDFVVLHQFLQFGFEIYRRISGPLYLQRFLRIISLL